MIVTSIDSSKILSPGLHFRAIFHPWQTWWKVTGRLPQSISLVSRDWLSLSLTQYLYLSRRLTIDFCSSTRGWPLQDWRWLHLFDCLMAWAVIFSIHLSIYCDLWLNSLRKGSFTHSSRPQIRPSGTRTKRRTCPVRCWSRDDYSIHCVLVDHGRKNPWG